MTGKVEQHMGKEKQLKNRGRAQVKAKCRKGQEMTTAIRKGKLETWNEVEENEKGMEDRFKR